MVPVTGLEPVRCRQRWILSPHGHVEHGIFQWNAMDGREPKKSLRCNDFLHLMLRNCLREPPSVKMQKMKTLMEN